VIAATMVPVLGSRERSILASASHSRERTIALGHWK